MIPYFSLKKKYISHLPSSWKRFNIDIQQDEYLLHSQLHVLIVLEKQEV